MLGTGKNGKDGKDGPAGKDGTDGKDGKDGAKGAPGVQGKQGKTGKDGKDGPPGVPPAAELDPIVLMSNLALSSRIGCHARERRHGLPCLWGGPGFSARLWLCGRLQPWQAAAEVLRACGDVTKIDYHAWRRTEEMAGVNGKDGKDGIPGKDGHNGFDGKAGVDGKDGKDGKDGPPGLLKNAKITSGCLRPTIC